MRLAKDDFQKLLNEPMLDWVEYAEAKDMATARCRLAGCAVTQRIRKLP